MIRLPPSSMRRLSFGPKPTSIYDSPPHIIHSQLFSSNSTKPMGKPLQQPQMIAITLNLICRLQINSKSQKNKE
ncbi:hypothetical protein MXB_5038 [Myxobolus squamalis]|nr:hypothetical protein MXB_5038 [Myxobolus squamalis]